MARLLGLSFLNDRFAIVASCLAFFLCRSEERMSRCSGLRCFSTCQIVGEETGCLRRDCSEWLCATGRESLHFFLNDAESGGAWEGKAGALLPD